MTLELPPGPSPADDPLPDDQTPPSPPRESNAAAPLTAMPDAAGPASAADPTAVDGTASPAPVPPTPPNAGLGSEPARSAMPRPATRAPQPSDPAALDNARRGIWVMNENHDGWVLLGADRKPVMRKDRSRVSFFFRNAARMAEELAGQDPADASDPVPLAPLDSGYNRDWNPQAQKSFLADITKACRLLAYQYVQFTEPQEAVRRAVSDILQNPTYVKEPQMNAWVPGKFDVEVVKLVATTLHKRVIGPEPVGDDRGDAMGGVLRDGPSSAANPVKASATSNSPTSFTSDQQLAQAGATVPDQRMQTIPGDKEPPFADRDGKVRNLPLAPRQHQTDDTTQALRGYRYSQFDGEIAQRETGGRPNEGYGAYVYGGGDLPMAAIKCALEHCGISR